MWPPCPAAARPQSITTWGGRMRGRARSRGSYGGASRSSTAQLDAAVNACMLPPDADCSTAGASPACRPRRLCSLAAPAFVRVTPSCTRPAGRSAHTCTTATKPAAPPCPSFAPALPHGKHPGAGDRHAPHHMAAPLGCMFSHTLHVQPLLHIMLAIARLPGPGRAQGQRGPPRAPRGAAPRGRRPAPAPPSQRRARACRRT